MSKIEKLKYDVFYALCDIEEEVKWKKRNQIIKKYRETQQLLDSIMHRLEEEAIKRENRTAQCEAISMCVGIIYEEFYLNKKKK